MISAGPSGHQAAKKWLSSLCTCEYRISKSRRSCILYLVSKGLIFIRTLCVSWAPELSNLPPADPILKLPGALRDSCFTNVFVGLALGLVLSASGLQDTSSWAPLGLLVAPFGLVLGSSWPPLGLSWLPFGFLWAPLRRSGTRFLRTFLWVSPWDLYCRPRRSKKPSLGLFLVPLGLLLAPLGLLLACSWRLLGSSWAPLGLLLAPLGLP